MKLIYKERPKGKKNKGRKPNKEYLDEGRIYGLYINGELVYIGATINSLNVRLRCHVSEAKKRGNRLHHQVILDALEDEGQISVVEIYPKTKYWVEYERFFVRMARLNGCNVLNQRN